MKKHNQLPKTALEAAQAGSKKFQSDQPCKYGHYSPRWTVTSACIACATKRGKKYREKMRELLLSTQGH